MVVPYSKRYFSRKVGTSSCGICIRSYMYIPIRSLIFFHKPALDGYNVSSRSKKIVVNRIQISSHVHRRESLLYQFYGVLVSHAWSYHIPKDISRVKLALPLVEYAYVHTCIFQFVL